jgi:diacylglycerol kinase family enzyme
MIPAFVNQEAGSAQQAAEHLMHDSRFTIVQLPARKMAAALRQAVRDKTRRVLVCGGDGTVALAAQQIAGTNTELAVFPGGTLNHFADKIGLSADPEQILDTAVNGSLLKVDVGYVNDHIFLNTSSVGAYVHFVRARNYLEKRMSYTFASMLAGTRRLMRMRSAHINLDQKVIKTPLVFVGVGEKELSIPFLGKDKAGGQRGLHLIAVLNTKPLATLGLAFNAMLRGIDPLSKAREVEDRVVTSLELNYAKRKRKRIAVALDGEIWLLRAPICYEFRAAAIKVAIPIK